MKKLTAIALSCLMLISFAVIAFAAEGYENGDVIEFGSYPQTHITDEALVTQLNGLASEEDFRSMGFYSGTGAYGSMTKSDFARYCDVELDGVKYRGVLFDSYRPIYPKDRPMTTNPYASYGYDKNITHWFRFEPLRWTVIDAENGLICASDILETRAVNEMIYMKAPDYYTDADLLYYANDYSRSTIREWLNDSFSDTAFTSEEAALISETEVDNAFNCYGGNEFTCENTFDKVFLLSVGETLYEEYFPDNESRLRTPTDYAKMEGIATYTPDGGMSSNFWYLRTPADDSKGMSFVNHSGVVSASCDVDGNDFGIVPALCADLDGIKAMNELPQKEDLYKDIIIDYENGMLMIGGTGILPDPENSLTDPLAEFRNTTAAVFIGSSITGVQANALNGFSKASMVIAEGQTVFEDGSLNGIKQTANVICLDKVTFSENTFDKNAVINVYEKADAPHEGTLSSAVGLHRYSFADGKLSITGRAELDYYTFLDIVSVFCTQYDEINILAFDEFISGDIYFRRFNEEDWSYEMIYDEVLTNTEFTVSIFGEYDTEQISFNELCRRTGDGSVTEFFLSAVSDEYEDLEETFIQILERMVLRALKWVVGLLNTIFSVFSKLFK